MCRHAKSLRKALPPPPPPPAKSLRKEQQVVPCFRSIETLTEDYRERRQPVLSKEFSAQPPRRLRERPQPAVLQELFDRAADKAGTARFTVAQSMRSVQELTREFRQRRHGAQQRDGEDGGRAFSREELLRTRSALMAARRPWQAPCSSLIGTITLPGPAAARQAEAVSEDPRLNDEVLIARLEARLSRESGADANNEETFGAGLASVGGWSFEDALEANERLSDAGCWGSWVTDPDEVHSMNCQAFEDRVTKRSPSTVAPSSAVTPSGSFASDSSSTRGSSPATCRPLEVWTDGHADAVDLGPV